MRAPQTITGGILGAAWLSEPRRRRITFAIAGLILAILSLWPQHYLAEAELLPQRGGGGLANVIAEQASGALLNLGALTGEKPTIEADLTIARSHAVLRKVIQSLQLQHRLGYRDPREAEVKLEKKLGIIATRGAMLEITARDSDPTFAKNLVAATASAIQERLGEISRAEAAEKRLVTVNRLADATMRLEQAQNALNQFRLANRLPLPEQQLTSGVGILAALQSRLQSTEVQLRALRQVATSDNIQVKVLEAEAASLREQIAATPTSGSVGAGSNLTQLSALNLQYFNLSRDEKSAELLYQIYRRYMDELVVEEMSADQSLDLVEPAYVDPARQFNLIPLTLLILVVLGGVAAEFYARNSRGPSTENRVPGTPTESRKIGQRGFR